MLPDESNINFQFVAGYEQINVGKQIIPDGFLTSVEANNYFIRVYSGISRAAPLFYEPLLSTVLNFQQQCFIPY